MKAAGYDQAVKLPSPRPSPRRGFAQKVGFGANFLAISGLNLTFLFPILSFWAKPP
jgi:hypothetical protein